MLWMLAWLVAACGGPARTVGVGAAGGGERSTKSPPDQGAVPPSNASTDACFVALGVRCSIYEEAYVKASNSNGGDYFGFALALDGDTLAVGAYGESGAARGVNGDQTNEGAVHSGAAYVFVRGSAGWTQQAYLKASNADAEDYFGFSVALDGDTLAVGARNEDSAARGVNGDQANNSADRSSAAYVFVRSGSVWTQQAYSRRPTRIRRTYSVGRWRSMGTRSRSARRVKQAPHVE